MTTNQTTAHPLWWTELMFQKYEDNTCDVYSPDGRWALVHSGKWVGGYAEGARTGYFENDTQRRQALTLAAKWPSKDRIVEDNPFSAPLWDARIAVDADAKCSGKGAPVEPELGGVPVHDDPVKDGDPCPECGEPTEYEAPYKAEYDTNIPAWRGGCYCGNCGKDWEAEPDTRDDHDKAQLD